MKRRTFVLIPLLMPFLNGAANAKPTREPQFSYVNLLENLTNPAAAAELGEQYLKTNPSMSARARLEEAVGNESATIFSSSIFELKRAKDFELGEIVCVEGWVLSKAELSLCALIHLETLSS